jgi:STAS-like domain of unknown function (DUF4325)
MVIAVKSFIPDCDTNVHGDALREVMLRALDESEVVEVSFAGVTAATSSFVNSAFVELLHIMAFDEIKGRIRITHSNRQINDMIRTRLTREAERLVAA